MSMIACVWSIIYCDYWLTDRLDHHKCATHSGCHSAIVTPDSCIWVFGKKNKTECI